MGSCGRSIILPAVSGNEIADHLARRADSLYDCWRFRGRHLAIYLLGTRALHKYKALSVSVAATVLFVIVSWSSTRSGDYDERSCRGWRPPRWVRPRRAKFPQEVDCRSGCSECGGSRRDPSPQYEERCFGQALDELQIAAIAARGADILEEPRCSPFEPRRSVPNADSRRSASAGGVNGSKY